ncbi:ABC transporter ATP-binding protein [Oscillatoriales cyanobacterium LEGE 11467]|uniref:histidine kinase n=1 Tax=Zarconia navalis LEGE 11467 TaxID=1828826 RepID=A0A928VXN8_9CYAN|nr:ABC transporter ATP-binding protein [Zarconia navalis]MBE9039680.1 ABC transporter ATP-binding protein [Zarconia navalis LEGE 11467]
MSSRNLIIKFALRHPILVVLTIIFGLSGAIFNGIGTALIVPLLLSFLGQSLELPGGPPILQKFVSLLDGFSPDNRLLLMTAIVLAAITLKNASIYANSVCSGALSQALVLSLRKEAIDLIFQVDLDFYAKHRTGDILNRVNTEVARTSSAIRAGTSIVSNILTISVLVVFLIFISWQLTIVSVFVLGLVAFINQYFVVRAKKYGQLLSKNSSKASVALQEILNGIRLIKATGNEESESKQIKETLRRRESAEFKSLANYAIIAPVNEISGLVTFLAIVILGGQFLSAQVETLSSVLLTYTIILFRLLPYIGKLNSDRSKFSNTSPSVEILADFLRRDNKPFMSNGSLPYSPIQDGICFEGVSFRYPGHDEFVLKEIDLWIPKGTTIALVGASGAGKSTVADLLPRFYDPTTGRITIDGRDLREYDLKSLRRSMGIVSQDTYLFNTSLRENIAYSREDATEEDIINAVKQANAYEFIVQLPEGFETQVGDRGVLLSGGQRQRLAIARALLYNPDILILDEATSALDTVSEKLVQQAIETLSRDRTTLVIAHRLSTIQNADRIAVMDKGKIVELGTHDELLAQGGYYANLYQVQFSTESQDAIERARLETLMDTSYEVRTRLNPTIGFLNLLADDLLDSHEERKEILSEAYESAVRLLKTLQYLEDSAKDKERQTKERQNNP